MTDWKMVRILESDWQIARDLQPKLDNATLGEVVGLCLRRINEVKPLLEMWDRRTDQIEKQREAIKHLTASLQAANEDAAPTQEMVRLLAAMVAVMAETMEVHDISKQDMLEVQQSKSDEEWEDSAGRHVAHFLRHMAHNVLKFAADASPEVQDKAARMHDKLNLSAHTIEQLSRLPARERYPE